MNKLLAALAKLQEATFIGLLALFPTQLGLHFWPEWSHIFGIRVDYLSPTLYLTDILIFFTAAAFFAGTLLAKKQMGMQRRIVFLLLLILLFAAGNILVSGNKFIAALKWLKVAELALLAFLVTRIGSKVLRQGLGALFVSSLVVSVVGILQFVFQRSLGGIFYLFGERLVTAQTPGAALVSLGGVEVLRSYSTFSHPNSLAGFLVTIVPISLLIANRKSRIFWLAPIIISVSVVLTFSRAGILVLGAVVLFVIFEKLLVVKKMLRSVLWLAILVSLLTPFLALFAESKSQSIVERFVQARAAGSLFALEPILGVGLGNFIVRSQEVFGYIPQVWQFQPVHNVFLLVLVETGIIGLLLITAVLWRVTGKCHGLICLAMLTILLTGMVDHYWFTLQQNQLLFSLVIGLSLKRNF